MTHGEQTIGRDEKASKQWLPRLEFSWLTVS